MIEISVSVPLSDGDHCYLFEPHLVIDVQQLFVCKRRDTDCTLVCPMDVIEWITSTCAPLPWSATGIGIELDEAERFGLFE